MTSNAAFAALIPAALFVGVATIGRARRTTLHRNVGRLGALAGAVGVVVAAILAAATAICGQTTTPTIGWSGIGLSVRLDALSVTMLAMIAVLAAVVFRYSRTYLEGNDRQGVFLGRLAATIAAVEVMVIAGNLVMLVAAWLATSLALHRCWSSTRTGRRAVVAARKKFIAARIGDAVPSGRRRAALPPRRHRRPRAIFESVATAVPRWAVSSVGCGRHVPRRRRRPQVGPVPHPRLAGRGHGDADAGLGPPPRRHPQRRPVPRPPHGLRARRQPPAATALLLLSGDHRRVRLGRPAHPAVGQGRVWLLERRPHGLHADGLRHGALPGGAARTSSPTPSTRPTPSSPRAASSTSAAAASVAAAPPARQPGPASSPAPPWPWPSTCRSPLALGARPRSANRC